jgi:deoxyribonuclease V
LASHVGLWLDLPTIGIAKSRLCGEHRLPALRRGSRQALTLDGRRIGTVLRTRDGVRPLYISVGHRVTLDDAVYWALRAGAGLRLPEPTRLADRLVARLKTGRE